MSLILNFITIKMSNKLIKRIAILFSEKEIKIYNLEETKFIMEKSNIYQKDDILTFTQTDGNKTFI